MSDKVQPETVAKWHEEEQERRERWATHFDSFEGAARLTRAEAERHHSYAASVREMMEENERLREALGRIRKTMAADLNEPRDWRVRIETLEAGHRQMQRHLNDLNRELATREDEAERGRASEGEPVQFFEGFGPCNRCVTGDECADKGCKFERAPYVVGVAPAQPSPGPSVQDHECDDTCTPGADLDAMLARFPGPSGIGEERLLSEYDAAKFEAMQQAKGGATTEYFAANRELIRAREALLSRLRAGGRAEHVTDLEEAAWGLIANASGGDWGLCTDEWRRAAVRWREKYHAKLGGRAEPPILHEEREHDVLCCCGDHLRPTGRAEQQRAEPDAFDRR